MLIKEKVIINGKEFIHHYSDTNKYIKQVRSGNLYDHAYDTTSVKYIYEETELEIEKDAE